MVSSAGSTFIARVDESTFIARVDEADPNPLIHAGYKGAPCTTVVYIYHYLWLCKTEEDERKPGLIYLASLWWFITCL